MNIICLIGEIGQGAGLLAQASSDGVSMSAVVMMLVIFGALVALIGMMTGWRKKRSSLPTSSPADPLAEARKDEPVGIGTDRTDRF